MTHLDNLVVVSTVVTLPLADDQTFNFKALRCEVLQSFVIKLICINYITNASDKLHVQYFHND